MADTFTSEKEFEDALVKLLSEKYGWESEILNRPTEKDLIENWKNILYENNRSIDRLNNYPLTDGEMQQILEKVTLLHTPAKLNEFINGGSLQIIRDNQDDKEHIGKEVSLKIYDRNEIAAGQSRYQIARQPVFKARNELMNDRRGDLMLLINGMPVIHIELKKSGVPVSEACNQIEKYAYEGVFSGIFSLVQIFVAMNPEKTLYFANPEQNFNKDFYFHWADFNNEPINDWKEIAKVLLSIPMAHEMIGFYTVADGTDGNLKVMRSYQYYAANAISDRVIEWSRDNKLDAFRSDQLGGFIWHTTGSGKTMTSFKSAQLIEKSRDADKVVFLMDRIELGTQSLNEYRGFAQDYQEVQSTDDTKELIAKLHSDNPADTLIVTSIQKMSRVPYSGSLDKKRIVFIVDECHRSTFGDMLSTIKKTFPKALFFGFTGTPIHEENKKKDNTTATVFGNELHRYSLADGIRDKNVLGFDTYKVLTFRDKDLREQVALEKAKADSFEEIQGDSSKERIFYKYMSEVPMAGYEDEQGKYHKGIEDIAEAQYNSKKHKEMVIEDILEQSKILSRNGKFHAILATQSIKDAVEYFRLLKDSGLNVAALFDPSIDNKGNSSFKEEGLLEIIEDYNQRFDQHFTLKSYSRMKKDIADRLSHKNLHQAIGSKVGKEDKPIDLLIVVDQMLTGFDSKWLNTLYLDKDLKYENIIQAFSRTNRVFDAYEKPFGVIRYYRKPHTMEKRIKEAVSLYSGDREFALFVDKLQTNLENMNRVGEQILDLFKHAGIEDFSRLPDTPAEKRKFAQLFNEFNRYLEAAKIQGFKWDQSVYENTDLDKGEEYHIEMNQDEETFLTLAMRYKELSDSGTEEMEKDEETFYNIDGHLTEIDTDKIDSDYMNSNFEKYLKALQNNENIDQAEVELHKSFARLSQEDQKFANLILHDIQNGDFTFEEGKTLSDYIADYKSTEKSEQIHSVAQAFGLDEIQLKNMLSLGLTEMNLNEYGRFEALKKTVDKSKAKEFFEKQEGKKLPPIKVNIKIDWFLRKFILKGEYEMKLLK